MYTYLLFFAFSVFFVNKAQRTKRFKNLKIYSFVALFLLCLLAGMRQETIGTDVLGYVKPTFENAINSKNIIEFYGSSYGPSWSKTNMIEKEFGYTITVYVVSVLTKSFGMVLFCLQFLVVFPIYYGLLRLCKKQNFNLCIAMFAYMMLFYNISLNLMIQFVAMGFLFLAYSYLVEYKYMKTIIFVLCAYLFHTSSIIVVVIFGSYLLLYPKKEQTTKEQRIAIPTTYSRKKEKSKSVKIFFMIVIALIPVFAISIIIGLLDIIGLGYYAGYIRNGQQFSFNQVLIRLPCIVLLFWNWKELKDTKRYFYLIMVYFDFLLGQFSVLNTYGYRIAYFFSLFNILLLSNIFNLRGSKKYFNRIAIIAYLIFFWLYYNGVGLFVEKNNTVPYLFFFQ